MADIDANAVFADLDGAIAAIRVLAALPEFTADAPPLSPAEAVARIAALEDDFHPHAAAIQSRLAGLAKDLNAAETAKTPFSPAAMMKMAASHRTGGAPDPLPALFHASAETGPLRPEDWSALITFAEARRRYFVYWFGTLENFRKNAIRRAAAL